MEDEENDMDGDSYVLGKERPSVSSKGGQLKSRFTVVSQNFKEEPSGFEDEDEDENDSNKNKDNKNVMQTPKDIGAIKKTEKEKNKEKPNNKITTQLKIIVLGNMSVGKTSIVGRYINNKFYQKYECTIQAQQQTKVINEDSNTPIRLNIWDTAGQEKFLALTRQYFRGAQGALVVFDLTDKKSFTRLPNWIDEIKNNGDKETVIVILGNKSDEVEQREIPQSDIDDFIKDEYPYFEVSAKNGNNISLAFEKLIKLMMDQRNRNIEQEKKEREKDKGKKKKDKKSKGLKLQGGKNSHEKNKRCC